jgi:hypothetical protein
MKYSFILLAYLICTTSFINPVRDSKPTAKCGPVFSSVNLDDNASDIYLVEMTNVNTGAVYRFNWGTTSGFFPGGLYNIVVHTDSQGYVKCDVLSSSQCQDAYSWSGDSKPYYFNNVSIYCCCTLTITIDDIECP